MDDDLISVIDVARQHGKRKSTVFRVLKRLGITATKQRRTAPSTPEERDWPLEYFETTFGSIDDETFVRSPQGELPRPVELD